MRLYKDNSMDGGDILCFDSYWICIQKHWNVAKMFLKQCQKTVILKCLFLEIFYFPNLLEVFLQIAFLQLHPIFYGVFYPDDF